MADLPAPPSAPLYTIILGFSKELTTSSAIFCGVILIANLLGHAGI
jgi:hypothetical protein